MLGVTKLLVILPFQQGPGVDFHRIWPEATVRSVSVLWGSALVYFVGHPMIMISI